MHDELAAKPAMIVCNFQIIAKLVGIHVPTVASKASVTSIKCERHKRWLREGALNVYYRHFIPLSSIYDWLFKSLNSPCLTQWFNLYNYSLRLPCKATSQLVFIALQRPLLIAFSSSKTASKLTTVEYLISYVKRRLKLRRRNTTCFISKYSLHRLSRLALSFFLKEDRSRIILDE